MSKLGRGWYRSDGREAGVGAPRGKGAASAIRSSHVRHVGFHKVGATSANYHAVT